jgi:ribonuclease P protein component
MGGKRFYSGQAVLAFAVPRVGGSTRVGVTVSRMVKGSVERNKARRRLRELARQTLLAGDSAVTDVGIRYDVVLIARPAALRVPFADLRAEVAQAALKLSTINP